MKGYALSGKGLAADRPAGLCARPCNAGTYPTAAATCLTGGRLMAAATFAPRCCHAKPEWDAFQHPNERNSP